MSSRRYVKRIWRVPKDRGATEYLATLICKALRKHGWPADWSPSKFDETMFFLRVHGAGEGDHLPDDFAQAVAICARIVKRTYRVDISEAFGTITLNRRYRITDAGQFREITDDLSG